MHVSLLCHLFLSSLSGKVIMFVKLDVVYLVPLKDDHTKRRRTSLKQPISNIPENPVAFIQNCVRTKQIHWTYHVNMRLMKRSIPRILILDSVDNFVLIESYPEDKYLPSYLIWSTIQGIIFHILFAVDVNEDNVRVVTAYKPDPDRWMDNMKMRCN